MAKAARSTGRSERSGGAIVGFIVLTLVAAAAGGGFGFYLNGQLEAGQSLPTAAEAPNVEEKRPALPSGSRLVALAPLITNLAEPRDVWMRIEASVLIDGGPEPEEDSLLSRQVSEDIVAYLKTATLAQFEGPSGFQNLREDLFDRARVRGGGHVKDIIIHGIIVE